MIDRCKAYVDAGAEIVFPEALHDEKDFEKVRKELSCYLLANMTEFGKTKLFNFKELISGITFETSVSSTTIPSKPFFMSSLIIHVHQY